MDAAYLKQYVPDGMGCLRAAVASVPFVGSALDHLLFDKAQALKFANVELSVKALSERLNKLQETAIDRAWFESEEAIAAFRLLSSTVSFEPDKPKIAALGQVVATCGTTKYARDSYKLAVLDHLSKLSFTQIKLLEAIAATDLQVRKVASGGIEQTAFGIWLSDLKATLEQRPRFWDGTLDLIAELEVLESLNAIRRVPLMGPSELGYTLTSIGKRASQYVADAQV